MDLPEHSHTIFNILLVNFLTRYLSPKRLLQKSVLHWKITWTPHREHAQEDMQELITVLKPIKVTKRDWYLVDMKPFELSEKYRALTGFNVSKTTLTEA